MGPRSEPRLPYWVAGSRIDVLMQRHQAHAVSGQVLHPVVRGVGRRQIAEGVAAFVIGKHHELARQQAGAIGSRCCWISSSRRRRSHRGPRGNPRRAFVDAEVDVAEPVAPSILEIRTGGVIVPLGEHDALARKTRLAGRPSSRGILGLQAVCVGVIPHATGNARRGHFHHTGIPLVVALSIQQIEAIASAIRHVDRHHIGRIGFTDHLKAGHHDHRVEEHAVGQIDTCMGSALIEVVHRLQSARLGVELGAIDTHQGQRADIGIKEIVRGARHGTRVVAQGEGPRIRQRCHIFRIDAQTIAGQVAILHVVGLARGVVKRIHHIGGQALEHVDTRVVGHFSGELAVRQRPATTAGSVRVRIPPILLGGQLHARNATVADLCLVAVVILVLPDLIAQKALRSIDEAKGQLAVHLVSAPFLSLLVHGMTLGINGYLSLEGMGIVLRIAIGHRSDDKVVVE